MQDEQSRYNTRMNQQYIFGGKVRKGKQRGKDLGFPTANIALDTTIPSGIYISVTTIDEETYPSLTFIGDAKTFGESLYQAETYLLDFDKNIYDTWVNIKLLHKIRENKKFTSAQSLIRQMQQDEIQARAYFKEVEAE